MKNLFLAALLLCAALLSCRNSLFPTTGRADSGAPGARYPERLETDTLSTRPTVYATALVFPDTAHWRAGSTCGARLVLFKNGEAVGGVPGETVLDPDHHHFQDGHLWTYGPEGEKTVVSRDGTHWFSFPGEETLRGFLAVGAEVHTLGQTPGGGFSYRVNGWEFFSSPSGLLLGSCSDPDWPGGAFSMDGGDIYYTYGITQASAGDNQIWEYRVMRGAEVYRQITLPASGKLYDVRVRDGHTHRLEWRYGRHCRILDESLTALPVEGDIRSLHWVTVDGQLMVKGTQVVDGQPLLWVQSPDSADVRYTYASPGYPQGALLVDAGELAAVVQDAAGFVCWYSQGGIRRYIPQGTYRLQSPRCAVFKNGIFALALTDAASNQQMLVVNREESILPFNGYFTGVYIE